MPYFECEILNKETGNILNGKIFLTTHEIEEGAKTTTGINEIIKSKLHLSKDEYLTSVTTSYHDACEMTEVTTVGDRERRFVKSMPSFSYPSDYVETSSYSSLINAEPLASDNMELPDYIDEIYIVEKGDFDIVQENSIYKDNKEVHIICKNPERLQQKVIYYTLYLMKHRLQSETMGIKLYKIECRMTPLVKDTLFKANKKLVMYGKKPPVIPRFDEALNRLPDEIKFDTEEKGIAIEIVDEDIFSDYHLELIGILEKPTGNDLYFDDLPF